MSIRDLTPWTRGHRPSSPERDYHPIQALHERMDRLFDDFFTGSDLPRFRQTVSGGAFLAPRIDVAESDTEYRFTAELPGVDEKDVEVTLSGGVITIKGEKRSETKQEKDRFLHTERSYGAFQRSFTMPPDVDEEQVEASFGNGVLTVTVAKSPDAKAATKRIEVRSA